VAAGGTGLAVGIVVTVLARPGGGGATAGAAAAVAAVVGFAAVIGLGQRRLGGYTGDVLGAAGVVGETLGLVAASAHW
jgi:adenosylcobinamide-GDP ribazoletransferase